MNKRIKTLLMAGAVALAGTCRAQTDETYLAVDLTATNYPVTYYTGAAEVPGGVTSAVYKTDRLLLRQITSETESYYVGVFEVTQGQWERVISGAAGTDLPKTQVNYPGMANFAVGIKNKTGLDFTLPTEAQWEYACRAGTTNLYHYGSDATNQLPDYAWYVVNSGGSAHPVGSKQPNAWGLYDMYGNVQEACLSGNFVRGGAYNQAADKCTSTSQGGFNLVNAYVFVGFRLCMNPPVTYRLTVVSGTGGGSYTNGAAVIVAASNLAHQAFVQWQVTPDLGPGFVKTSATNTVVMPASPVTLTATYTPVLYALTVNGGTPLTTNCVYGQVVAIAANGAPALQVFDRWTGDTNTVADIFAAATAVTVPDKSIALTATYKNAPFTLTVASGSGGGLYAHGEQIPVKAGPPPPWQTFDRWVSNKSWLGLGAGFDLSRAETTVTMPTEDVTLTATYKMTPYTLTLVNGAGGGNQYTNGQSVAIAADSPPQYSRFERWVGDIATVANVTSATTTVTIPGTNITLTATYTGVTYRLTVTGGGGAGDYTVGAAVGVTADAPPPWQMFDGWEVVSGWGLGDGFVASDAQTTVSMPPRDVTLRATYKMTPFTLAVVSGSGDGVYTNGQSVAISADYPAQYKRFDRWAGDTNTVANVTNAATTVTIPGTNITLTATYADLTYRLTVTGGGGDGDYTFGAAAAVTADAPPPWQMFDRWEVVSGWGLGEGFVAADAATTVTMPPRDVTLMSTYKMTPFTLAVVSGSGDGVYTNGQRVAVAADAPASYKKFDRWAGDTNAVADIFAANTTVTIPGASITLIATYADAPYTVTVIGGGGGGDYTTGTVVRVTADAPPQWQMFDAWEVVPSGAAMPGFVRTSADTTFLMPGMHLQLRATYKVIPYALVVVGGSGDGTQYTNGQVVAVTADAPAQHKHFDRWTGDTNTVADIFAAATAVTIPGANVTLTATYADTPYTVTVIGGSGGGDYTTGTVVRVTADAPPQWQMFGAWEVLPANAVMPGFVTNSAAATFRMPGVPLRLTATYTPILYPLTVTNGLGSGSYAKGTTVTVAVAVANLPTAGHEFDRWTGATQIVANVFAPTTTVVIAGSAATLTPVFRPKPVLQNTYMVLDLSVSATNEAVSYRDEPPAGGWDVEHKTTRMVLRRVLAGTFAMGSPANEPGRWSDETQHGVTFTKDFYIGVFEVTQKQWERVSSGRPGLFDGGADTDAWPVEQVSYADIRGTNSGAKWPASSGADSSSFVGRVRTKTGLSTLDLPTEAQWEYACRAGTGGAYAGSLDDVAWYGDASQGTQEVGTKDPNAWGLYDMHGNVWELCLDWYDATMSASGQTDPKGAASSPWGKRIMRGGAYESEAQECRAALRGNQLVTNAFPWAGLRLAQTLPSKAYRLTVVNGLVNTGGFYTAGTAIGISPAPSTAGKLFTSWQVTPAGTALGAGFATNRANALITMPAGPVTVTAVYGADAPVEGFYRLRQTGPDGTTDRLVQSNATVTVTAPSARSGYVFSLWIVSPADALLGSGFNAASASTALVMPAQDVALTATYLLDEAASGGCVGVAFTLDAGANDRPARFTAKGLPSGLRMDAATGVIAGVPTRAGLFNVAVTVKKADGATAVSMLPLTVGALAPGAQGEFTGYAYATGADELSRMNGMVTLSVSSAGKLSAKVTTQTTTGSFSAASWAEVAGDVYRATLRTSKNETLEVEADAGSGALTGVLHGGVFGAAGDVAGQRNAFALSSDLAAQGVLAGYLGYYTASLPVVDCVSDPSNNQNGSGYVTLSVKTRGAVSVAGKLADGTTFSAATTLLVDGDGTYVPLFAPLYSKRGVVSGLLRLTGGAAPTQKRIGAHEAFLTQWVYPGKSASATADGFDVSLGAFGAYYDKLINLQTYYGAAVFTAEGQAWEVPLTFSASGTVSLGAGADNPAKATLRVTKSTGLFSGAFYSLVNGRNVSLKHYGVLTRDGDAYLGDGAYVVPQTVGVYKLKPSYGVTVETP